MVQIIKSIYFFGDHCTLLWLVNGGNDFDSPVRTEFFGIKYDIFILNSDTRGKKLVVLILWTFFQKNISSNITVSNFEGTYLVQLSSSFMSSKNPCAL